ncbi:RNA polymerase [Avian metapneumovirus type D]|uniref:RNA-directed RNA polymerase L n=2 Tax=avian metapneumovirus TaxID=38525 RepID=A0A077SJI6_9MONO|nr:RNA polymerase [Avian metapneumovirus type D]
MDAPNESAVNVYLPDSYLKGVISFSETNALGSCILNVPYIKDDFTAHVAMTNAVLEHSRMRSLYRSLTINRDYVIVEPLVLQNELLKIASGGKLKKLKKWLGRSKDISEIKLRMIAEWLKLAQTPGRGKIMDCIQVDNLPEWLEHWFDSWMILNEVVQQYRCLEVAQTGAILRKNCFNFFFAVSSFGCIIISRKSKRICFCTYNQLLTWKDLALSRFNANLCVWVSNCLNSLQDGLGLRSKLVGELLNRLYCETDELLSMTGNEGYGVVKEFEGFIMSEILRMTEHAQFSLRFRNTLLNGIAEKIGKLKNTFRKRAVNTSIEYHCYPSEEQLLEHTGRILKLIRLLVNNDKSNAAEMYFIFRIFGHPMVEEREAMDAVRENSEVTKILSLRALAEMRGAFILRVIKGFVGNYKRWPRIKNPSTLSRRWRMYLSARTYPSNLELCPDDFLELAGVSFCQEFQVPNQTSLEMVLNDKAISPPKSLIWSVYPKNYLPNNIQERFRLESLEKPEHEKTRRVLEFYLKDSTFKQDDLKKYVVLQKYLGDKEHVVSLTGKERELSVGRMFAMQPGKQRQVQILAEKLLAENIVPFFPETLTRYGDLELQRIMELKSELSSTKTRRSDSYNNYIARASIVTDLSKFNQAFRYETTAVCADVADELHGTQSLFCWLHLTVSATTMICTYRHAPPDTGGEYDIDNIPEQSGLYRYHMGGIEGWCQKMWTMEAISLLDVVSVKNRVQLTSLLNGDNQSIDVSKPVRLTGTQTEIQADYSLAIKMLTAVRDAYYDIGHKLKEGETYVSRDLQFMSKTIQSEGVMYPAAIKKVLRVGPWINTILDDIKTSMEAIGSLCQELEFRGESLMTSVIIRNFWLYIQCFVEAQNHSLAGGQVSGELNRTLTKVMRFFKLKNETSTVNLYMNTPMQLGGGDPVVVYRSFYRRTPDFLTEVITHMELLLTAIKIDRGVYMNFFLTLLNTCKNDKATLTTLMRDPQAIGSERQAKITSEINRTAVTSVLSLAPNQLFSDSAVHFSQNEEEIGTVMSRVTPVYPHGLRVVYEAFPFHKAEKVVNMIAGTKSITNILQRTSAISGVDIDRAVHMMILNLGLLGRILESGPVTDNIELRGNNRVLCCQLSKKIRESSWDNLEIVGVSSPSMLSCLDVNYVTVAQHPGILVEKFTAERTTRGKRGPKAPWVGSSTQEKKLVAVYNRQALSKDQRDQLETIGKIRWVYKGVTGLRRLLNMICHGTLGLPYKLLKPLLPRFMSVNFLHRLAVSSRPMEFPSSVPAYRTTNFHFDTSPINKKLSERFGNEDINLVFQNAISCGISVMCVVEQLTGRSPKQVILEPVVEDIDIMSAPNFQGRLDYKSVKKIVSDQHIFNPDHISLMMLGKLLLPTIKNNLSGDRDRMHTENFFTGNNIVEVLTCCLACHWCTVLILLTTENSIFQKEWGDGFITDHAFLNFDWFLMSFKTYLLCHWSTDEINAAGMAEDPIDRLIRVDNSYWRMMSKVFLEPKVKRRLMLYDTSIVNILGSLSFKNWFVSKLRFVDYTEIPWIVNAEGDIVERRSVGEYLRIMTAETPVKVIMLSYSDMAHAMTRLLRCKNMQDNVPTLKKTLSPSDITPSTDPTRALLLFPKIHFSKLTTFNAACANVKQGISSMSKNYMTLLPWHHVNRYNFVHSSTGCKVSVKSCIGKLVAKLDIRVIYFVGEGAGNLMSRTACEYPGMKFVYRSLKDANDHHHPTEYVRVMGSINRVIDIGEGLAMEATDATRREHWDFIHRISKEPLLLTVCDAELKDTKSVLTLIIQWRKHVLSCQICTSYGTNVYMFVKFHAQSEVCKLPHFVRIVSIYVMQGSKLSGSECYLLISLGHQNSAPCYGEVRAAKAIMALANTYKNPYRLDKSAVETNLKSLAPGLSIPLREEALSHYLNELSSLSGLRNTGATIGGSKIVEKKWAACKVSNVVRWLSHVLRMPKGELNYDFFEVVENTYPNMVQLLDNLNPSELKKLVKVTGYILSIK